MLQPVRSHYQGNHSHKAVGSTVQLSLRLCRDCLHNGIFYKLL